MQLPHKLFRYAILMMLLALAGYIGYLSLRHPSNDRNWSLDQKILPYADIKGNLITIHNIRNFTYRTPEDYTPGYYDRTFDLNQIKKVYYVVEPFSEIKGPAHTFLSFEFEGNKFVAISIEIRKQEGQQFSYLRSIYNGYELMYVIADENDVVKLRSNYRKDQVFVYPIRAEIPAMRSLFLSMVERANKLKAEPEFYNIFTNTCTTNIVNHVNEATEKHIPFSLKYLLPAYSDEFAYDLGLIDFNGTIEQAHEKFRINERAEKYANDPNFSVKIRTPLN